MKKFFTDMENLLKKKLPTKYIGDVKPCTTRVYYGFLNVSNPYSKRLHLKVNSGGLREMGSWDAFRTKQWFAPRPIPSVLYFFRCYFGTSAAKRALWRTVPLSIMPYQFKTNKPMMVVGVFVSLLLTPIVLFQVFKSWRLSSR